MERVQYAAVSTALLEEYGHGHVHAVGHTLQLSYGYIRAALQPLRDRLPRNAPYPSQL
jgi:hypothetical protein